MPVRIVAALCVGFPAIALLAGCATPYKSADAGKGYSDFRITTDVFAVSFRGSAGTFEETVDRYLLRRASELTLEHGFTYFVILSEKERTRSSSLGYSGFKIPIIAPGTSVWIRCFEDLPPDHGLMIDAADFLRFNFPEALKEYAPEEADEAKPTSGHPRQNG
jgi:hypothetical protein